MKKQKLFITASYYASFVAMGISMASLGPTLPALAQVSHSSLSGISILFTARALGSLIGSVWGGQMYDRMRGHRVMAFMVALMAVLTALTPVVPLLWLLTTLLFLTGAVQGILNIGGNALLVWVHGEEVGPFMNGLHFCFGLGTFITPVIVAQFILHEGGLIWIYVLLAVIILPTAAMIFLPSPPAPHTALGKTNGKLDPILIILISLIFGCYSGASMTFGGWIFSYATTLNLTNEVNAAYLTSVFWGMLTVGRLVAIPIAIRFSPRTILMADFLAAGVSLLAMLIWPKSILAVTITSAGLGLALASIYPTAMSLSGQLMVITGKVTGLFSIGNSIGMMVVPWIVGQFFDTIGPQSMTSVLLVDMVLAVFVLLALARWSGLQPVMEEG